MPLLFLGLQEQPTNPFPVLESITLSTYNSSSTTTFTVNMPATRPDGDLYIAFVSIGSTGAITPGAGWTELGETTNSHTHEVARKVGASEPATYTWTSGTAATNFSAVVYRVSGYDPNGGGSGTPIHTSGVTAAGTDATAEFDSLTTTVSNCLILGSASANGSALVTVVPADYEIENTAALDRALYLFRRYKTAAGSVTGTVTFDVSNNWQSGHVAIAPTALAAGSTPVFAEVQRRPIFYLVR